MGKNSTKYRYKNYSELKKVGDERKRIIKKEFPKLILTIENLLTYMNNLHISVQKKCNSENIQMNQVQSIIDLLLIRNCHYLWGCYQLTCSGLNDPSKALQRVVFESIVRIYFFYLLPEDPRTKISIKQTLNELTDEDKKEKNKYRNLNFNEFLDILYKGNNHESLKEFYKLLCESSHPDIKGLISSNIEFNKDIVEDNLTIIISLEYSNLLLMFEVYGGSYLSDEFDNFNKKIQKIAKILGEVPNLIPNNEKFKSKFKLKRTSVNE